MTKHSELRAAQKAGQAERERNRTAVAQLNAEIRREKAKLRDQLPDLVKASKKKAKRLAPEKKEERKAKIAALEEQLEGVPDGTAHERRKKAQDQAGPIHINLDVNNMRLNPLSMEHSDESEAFRGEFVRSRQKQDEGLDQISKGLRVLKDLSSALSDELKKQARGRGGGAAALLLQTRRPFRSLGCSAAAARLLTLGCCLSWWWV